MKVLRPSHGGVLLIWRALSQNLKLTHPDRDLAAPARGTRDRSSAPVNPDRRLSSPRAMLEVIKGDEHEHEES
jgi:hypothetical protein